jgi:serine/threonine-protein kinase
LFDMWFARACNRDPTQRFHSAKDMVSELAHALGVVQGAGITTGSGNRFGESSGGYSFQQSQPAGPNASGQHPTPGYNTPTPGQTGQHGQLANPGVSGPYPAMASTAPPMARSQTNMHIRPGVIPGTVVGVGQHAMEGTNVPIIAAAMPLPRKKSSTPAVLLGMVIAVLLCGGVVGVFMVMPNGQVESASQGAGETNMDTPPATEAVDDGDGDEEGNEEPAAEPTASASASASDTPAPEASTPTPAPAPAPPPVQGGPLPKAPLPTGKPPGPQPAAPKVDNIDF